MKISSEQIRRSIALARIQHPSNGASSGRNGQENLVSLDVHEILKTTRQRLLNSPDVRIHEVRHLQSLIHEDNYDIPPDEIAEKLLGRVLSDQIR